MKAMEWRTETGPFVAKRGLGVALCLCILAPALAACDSLGFGKTSPDEFQVMRVPELIIPPEYTLRPPAPGAPGPQVQSVRSQAEADLIESTASERPAGETPGEAALIEQAGAQHADPNIRRTIKRDFSNYAEEDESFVDSLLFWREDQPLGTVVDAEAEAQRLRENEALGAPPTEGETPTIQQRERALLEDLF